jgi:hypothetical protein
MQMLIVSKTKYVPVTLASALMQVSAMTIHDWISRGVLVANGKPRRVPLAALERLRGQKFTDADLASAMEAREAALAQLRIAG